MEKKIRTAYLSMGGNIGDREENLRSAVRFIRDHEGIESIRTSSLYETEPVGYDDQPYFLNICAEVRTTLTPYELLDLAHETENLLGRKRGIRFGPRTVDVDILLYEDFTSDDKVLTVPHPRMYERAFVLVPLKELTDIDVPVPEDKSVVLKGPFEV
ncbi:MAG: 2-amino-4-hydroxy-6-hydroxymethyldihydropteridine diphosphokinase [Clostridiales bacterium]|nr:2-amino-4-hydroxy-6-hydroxymethyldihydropteridine diphosphokinase [Clostridiales bacterium]